ncbi:MAG: amino acid--tRNA ligase-related protein, partial [Rikenellaceae bacterium]
AAAAERHHAIGHVEEEGAQLVALVFHLLNGVPQLAGHGVEVGGGSIRIHDREIQQQMFKALGFTPEAAEEQFGFLLNAFRYGAPPHGGIAFGFDRWCSMFGGTESIRDYIAFPKNNSGRDVMIDSPAPIAQEQLKELSLNINKI